MFNKSDVYVINQNFEVVYLKGIKHNGNTYYQYSDDKNQVDDLNKKTITEIAEGGGTVEGWTKEPKTLRTGETITLKAIPNKVISNGTEYSYDFAGWYLNDELLSTEPEYTITVTNDATYVAKFVAGYTFIYYADESIVVDTSTTINQNSGYKGDTNIKKIEFGKNCTEIQASAFNGCTGLESIESSGDNNLYLSGMYVFQGCTGLTTVNMPNVSFNTGYSGYQFNGCTNLEDITLGSRDKPVSAIGQWTFQNAKKDNLIIKIYVGSNVTTLGDGFGATNATMEYYDSTTGNLKNVILGCKYKGDTEINFTEIPNADKITKIKANAFNGCTNLALTSLPTNLTFIGGNAFSGCKNLKITNIPSSCTEIQASAFNGCTGLESIESSGDNNLNLSGLYVFQGCTSLTTVNLRNVSFNTGYGGYQFNGCTNLEDVALGSKDKPVSAIGTGVFQNAKKSNLVIKIYVTSGTSSLGSQPWGATNATIEYYDATSGTKIN